MQNETGTIYPVRDLARLARARSPRALLHVDAVQALGKVEIDVAELGCDTLAVSAHKVHGPQGAGALFVRAGTALLPLVHGGGQEGGLRSGTENVAAIVGFGVAARIAEEERARSTEKIVELRARLVRGLSELPGARVLEPGAPTLVPHVVAVVLPGVPSEVRMHHLEELGVVVSAGSACQSAKSAQSPSLLALGLSPEEVRSLLRVSLARTTTIEEVERALAAFAEVGARLAKVQR
ncbi:MAG: aminotransferase class V-fold PLP-dependent enzyme [Planctomycetes bacterium]|nr:aminotransferase class V-fold PLP-dependent enzyme [Planctomycetota bacterium]